MKKRRRRTRLGPPTPFWSKTKRRWIVRYRQSGRPREKQFREKQQAAGFATEVWQDIQDGIDCQDMRLEDLITRFLASKSEKSGSTQTDYRRTLNHAEPLYSVPIRMLRPLALDELIGSMKSTASRKRLRGTLSSLFKQAVKWELLRRNPIEGTQPQKHRAEKCETFSPEEVASILEAAESHRLVGLFDIGFTLGVRPAELFGLQWQDWNDVDERLSIRRKVAEVDGQIEIGPPKTVASVRDLDLPPHITERLIDRRRAALKEGAAKKADWIFTNRRGGPIRNSNLRVGVWTPLLKRAGVRYLKPYCMRHTAASTMLNGFDDIRGVPLAVVAETLGHDNPQITLERYSHVMKTDQRHVVDFWKSAKRCVIGGR